MQETVKTAAAAEAQAAARTSTANLQMTEFVKMAKNRFKKK
jgi:hypothetical protein